MRKYNGRSQILVTGGAGFLGSHLCERLLADRHDAICVDNFYTGTRANIERLLDHPRFELMRHDVTMPRSGARLPCSSRLPTRPPGMPRCRA